MRKLIFILLIPFFNFTFCQEVEKFKKFDIEMFNELLKKSCPENCEIKTFYNKNFISFTKNDTIYSMSYNQGSISWIYLQKGNLITTYEYYSNLNIKKKNEKLDAISRSGSMEVGKEIEYDEKGNVIKIFDWDKIPFDENVPGPKKSIWELAEIVKIDFQFDILNDTDFFGVSIKRDEKTKKIYYLVSKFVSDDNKLLKLVSYKYDGDSGKFISKENIEWEIPDDMRHY